MICYSRAGNPAQNTNDKEGAIVKKVWLLMISMLFLAACGGGGGGGSTAGTGGGTGTLTLQLTDPSVRALALIPPAAGWVRVVVSNANLNGKPYKQFVDFAFGPTASTITVPSGTGFTAEVVYYAKENGLNRITRYGKSATFDITDNTSTTVSITPNAIVDPVISAAATGTSLYTTSPDNTYGVTATVDAAGPLQNNWSLAVQTGSPFTAPVHLAHSPTATYTNLVVPSLSQPYQTGQLLYFQGEFFIKTSLIDSTEQATNWTYNVVPADTTALTLLVHGGTFDITPPADITPPQITSLSVPTAKLTSAAISPITINGTDNVAVKCFQITESSASPAAAGCSGWIGPMFRNYTTIRNYTTSPLAHGTDVAVHLYAWAQDAAGLVSSAVAGVTDKIVTINDSPQILTFSAPATVQLSTTISGLTITGKNNTGADNLLRYLLTESLTPAPTSANTWSAANTPPTAYTFTSPATLTPGVYYNKPLYAWTIDGNNSVSAPLTATVTISDSPRVTAFTVPTTSQASPQITRDFNVTVTGAPGLSGSITGYMINESSAIPSVNATASATSTGWVASAPTTYTYGTTLTSGVLTNRYLYAWVKDSRGIVSRAAYATILFQLP
jgi:hypothetical protein